MKKMNRYYYQVGIPTLGIVAGIATFFDAIVGTVQGNPHPQINYLIFVLIPLGMIMMILQIHRMNKEGFEFDLFYQRAKRAKTTDAVIKLTAQQSRADSVHVMEFVAEMLGRKVTSLQQSALDGEIERFEKKLVRRLNISQFLGGLMVGLGLLGTFIGLLGALGEIGKLIGSFSTMANADATGGIRELVQRLTTPMQAMGVAFSASLFGVLGSLIMGVFLVSVRNCSSELMSVLRSRVSILMETGTGEQETNIGQINHALATIAEQSPILGGLMKEMTQAEFRTRDLIEALTHLVTKVDLQDAKMHALLVHMDKNQEADAAAKQSLAALLRALPMLESNFQEQNKQQSQLLAMLSETRNSMVDSMDAFQLNAAHSESQNAQREVMFKALIEIQDGKMQALLAHMDKNQEVDAAAKQTLAALLRAMPVLESNFQEQNKHQSQLLTMLSETRNSMVDSLDAIQLNASRSESQNAQREVMFKALIEIIQMEIKELHGTQGQHYEAATLSRRALSSEAKEILETLKTHLAQGLTDTAQWQAKTVSQFTAAYAEVSKTLEVQTQALTLSNNRIELALRRSA